MQENRKIHTGIWLAVLFSVSSIYFIFHSFKGIHLSAGINRLNWFYVVFGFFVQFLVWLAKACRMYAIADGMGSHVPLTRFFQIYMATCFVSHVTPFNSGGTPLEVYLLTKQGIAVGTASAITVVDLGLNTAMFFILAVMAAASNFGEFTRMLDGGRAGTRWLWMIGIVMVVMIILAILVGYYRRPKSRGPGWTKLRQFLHKKGWLDNLAREARLFKEGWLMLSRGNPSRIFWASLATVVYWLLYLLLAPLIIWALGKPVSFWGLIGAQLIFNLAQIFIPTPGGSGGSELILGYFFRSYTGVSLIGLFVLIWKVYTFYSTLILGGIFFLRLTRGGSVPKSAKND
ncbi:MAG TPA: lysylphosphatidylglycerol synthase transmembrane domain-containing protein [Bacillota bacterium]